MTDRKMWKTGRSVGGICEEYMEESMNAGISALEISALDTVVIEDSVWKKIPKWSKRTGVEAWSMHLPYYKSLSSYTTLDAEEWNRTFKVHSSFVQRASEAELKVCVVHPSFDPQFPDEEREERLQAVMEHLSLLSDVCKKNGLTLAVENMAHKGGIGGWGDEMLRIMQSNSDLRVCFDVNHLLKESHAEFMEKVGKYVISAHISDYDFVEERHWFPMQGKINWRDLQLAFEKADYNGPFIYETSPAGVTWEDYRKNHDILKSL